MIDDDIVTTDDGKLAMVEFTEEALKYRGPTGYFEIEKALLGEALGKWRIKRRSDKDKLYETGVMIPSASPLVSEYETKVLKKKRIAWVQDHSRNGGAEISNALVVRIGLDCGFHIITVEPTMPAQKVSELLGESDLIVLNNIWEFSEVQISAIMEAVGQKPYVKYEHDHRELDRPEFSKKLFQGSVLNVFLSPVHLKNHQEKLGIDGICLPLAIDIDFFKPVQGIIRKKNSALVCNVRNFKSWTKLQTFIDGHPDWIFTLLASNPVVHGDNVVPRPMVRPEEMPATYSAHEYVVHLLDGWGAGERVIFEAALCGCKIISDERAGHMSWGKDLNDLEGLRTWLKQAPFDFWKEVDKLI